MGKWLNGVQIAGQVPVATAGLFAPALPAWSRAQAVALQTEMDASKERLVTVEEALDLLLSGVTE